MEINELFKLNSEFTENSIKLYDEAPESLILIDDFYLHPEDVIKYARTQKYHEFGTSEKTTFPGKICMTPNSESVSKFLTEKSSIKDPDIFSKFQLQPKSKESEGRIHVDLCPLVVLVYLGTHPENEPEGTMFYRHKETRVTMHHPDHLVGAALNSDYCVKSILEILYEDRKKPEKWDLIHTVEFKSNRALLYPGYLFHNGTFWGETPERARLVHGYVVKPKT